jgi:hypothetical protein
MAEGLAASDWTVRFTGDEGTVECDEFSGRFKARADGDIDIIWQDGPEADASGPVERAAREAIDAVIRPQSGS